jgi:hypothetical protein
MLVYEKIVDGVKHLYGTFGNVPSDDDTQLSYKDEAGKEISDVTTFKLFYGTPKLMKASLTILPTDDDTVVNVFLGDTILIGTVDEVDDTDDGADDDGTDDGTDDKEDEEGE